MVSDDLIDVQENGLGRSYGGDIGDEFEVAGLFANEESPGVARGLRRQSGERRKVG